MAYSFQTFTLSQILTAAEMNQVEVNIRDHQHGIAGVADGPAAQSDQETGTNLLLFVTPARQQFHPSALKGWVKANVTGGVIASYNVTSVTDVGVGLIRPTWGTDFSSASYVVAGTTGASTIGFAAICNVDDNTNTPTAGTTDFINNDHNGAILDPQGNWYLCAMGDQ